MAKSRSFTATRTPPAISGAVLALCEMIRPGGAPVYLRVTPETGSLAQDCFRNVQRRVEREGGASQPGWSIWLWPRVLVEAEHHAVYVPPWGGAWEDNTPSPSGEKRRLFLPDDSAGMRHPDGQRRDNIRMALSADPLVLAIIDAAVERTQVWKSGAGVDDAATEAARFARLQAAEFAQAQDQVRVAMKYTAPRDLCFCASGKRFKHCHGRAGLA